MGIVLSWRRSKWKTCWWTKISGSLFFIEKDFNRRLNQVGSKGKEHNMIVSLRLRITECFMGSYNKVFVEQVRGFVSI